MTFSGIITIIIIILIFYYIGMIAWEQYQFAQEEKDKTEIMEEEIDIGQDLNGDDNEPILVEVSSDSYNLKREKKAPKFPFPWTSEQIYEAFEKLQKEEECPEMDNVVFYTPDQLKKAI